MTTYHFAERWERRMKKNCGLKNPPSWITDSTRYLNGLSLNRNGREQDSRRQKFYDAEKSAPRGESFDSVPEVEDYIDRLTGYAWWQRRFLVDSIKVGDGRGRKRACGSYRTKRVKLPRYARYERLILHEMTHTLTPKPHAWHGRLFCRIFLELVDWQLGSDAADALKEGYREQNVKWQPHRSKQY